MFRQPVLPSLIMLAALALAGCEHEQGPQPPEAIGPAAPTVAQPEAAPVETAPDLRDVIETTPSYIVGISYPKAAAQYPALALALHAYAEAARKDLMQAVAGLKNAKPTMPYDLSLQFSTLVETPRVVAVAAEGSSYTGGAHGMPLVERFIWLPQQQQMLAAEQLIPDLQNWKPVTAYVREQLMTRLSQEIDADDELSPDDRAQQLRNSSHMIDEGTTPEVRNFSRFEPVMNADGSIRALRFVFPPYQVGPYSDGTQTVDVPAKLLRPLVAADYRDLFRAE